MELKVDDIIDLDIKRMGINGEGIGYYQRLAIFVNGAIPGEYIKARITEVREKMAIAKIEELKRPSKDRIVPKCPYYERCGGCQTAHINYDAMSKFKRDAIKEALERYTDINYRTFEIKETVKMENPYGYRYKSSLPVRKMNEHSTVGLYNPNDKEIVYIDTCLVQNEIVNEINTKVLKLMDELNVVPYLDKFRRGEVKYIVTRVSHKTLEAQVTLVTFEKTPKIFELAKRMMDIEHVVSVYESLNDSDKEGIIFGNNIKLLQGKETIVETIGNYKFNLLPNAFFQLNPVQTEVLYEIIKKASKLSFKENVLDLYCGVGTIGLYLSKLSKEVKGIEFNNEAVINANDNAKLNKVKNASFYQGDVNEVLPTLIEEGFKPDVIVVDPPRTGLGSDVIDTILNTTAKRIVYVSCNPATLAKDLNLLVTKYDIKSIAPVDMFPFTSHVESVCLLELKK